MPFGWFLDGFWSYFWMFFDPQIDQIPKHVNVRIIYEKQIRKQGSALQKSIKNLRKLLTKWGRHFGMHFSWFWLHFGRHFGDQIKQKTMTKVDTISDVVWEGQKGGQGPWNPPWDRVFALRHWGMDGVYM